MRYEVPLPQKKIVLVWLPHLQPLQKEKSLLPWKVGGWIITRKTLILKGGWVDNNKENPHFKRWVGGYFTQKPCGQQGGLAKKWNPGTDQD